MINKILKFVKWAAILSVIAAGISLILIIPSCMDYARAHLTKEHRTEVIQITREIDYEDQYGIPCYNTFLKIQERPYAIQTHDCSNKSMQFLVACEKKGLNCLIVVVVQGREFHTLVWVEFWGYYDPTQRTYYNIPGTRSPELDWQFEPFLTYQWGMFNRTHTKENALLERPEEFSEEDLRRLRK